MDLIPAEEEITIPDSDHESGDDDDGDGMFTPKRRRNDVGDWRAVAPVSQLQSPTDDSSPISKRELRRERTQRQFEYYSRSYFSVSCSVVLLDVWLCICAGLHHASQLVRDLNRSSPNLLWLAIVGLTDQYIHERITLFATRAARAPH